MTGRRTLTSLLVAVCVAAIAQVAAAADVRSSLRALRPAGPGEYMPLALRIITTDQRIVGADIRFGNGTRKVLRQPCSEDRRVRLLTMHRFRRIGWQEVTYRVLLADSCAPTAKRSQSAPHSARVRVFPARVTVPKLVGLSPSDAKCRLGRAGLRWRYRGDHSRPGENPCAAVTGPGPILAESTQVVYQSERPGARVPVATFISIDTCGGRACA